MVNPLDVVMKWCFDNIFILVLVGIVGYFAWSYLRFKRSSITKPINRSEIERMKFIERMKHNPSHSFKWLLNGNKRIGKITHYRTFQTNPSHVLVAEIVVKPCMMWKIINPFAKSQAFMINMNEDSVILDNDKIVVHKYNYFDYYFGVYYDLTIPTEHMKIIKNDNVIRTDLNELASVYYCKSQEQSTFDPIRAHQLALEEKKLEIELAKARGKAETV